MDGMPSVPFDPFEWRKSSIKNLCDFLFSKYNCRSLSQSELKGYHNIKAKFSNGWRVPGNENYPKIDVLVDTGFPYSLVRTAIPEGFSPLEQPHIERERLLCVLPAQSTISTRAPIRVAEEVLKETFIRIDEFCGGSNDDDFREEFLSYWALGLGDKYLSYVSLCKPIEGSRSVVVWHGNKYGVFADDRPALEAWLINQEIKKPGGGFKFYEGVLLWLKSPLLPNEYPEKNIHIYSIASSLGQDAKELLKKCTKSDSKGIDVLIGARTKYGSCFAATFLGCPKKITGGFREQNVPEEVLVGRYFDSSKLDKRFVDRADRSWIHGRDQDATPHYFENSNILLIGCGAIGGGVARLLAQSGVNFINLVDNEKLEWSNISRHVLGASCVRENKALALAKTLKKDFPHLKKIEGYASKFDLSNSSLIKGLPKYDLIISATGEWSVDDLLNDIQRSNEDMPPIVYGWLETFAAAAHAVYIPPKRSCGCFRCGFNDRGVPILKVSEWPDEIGLLHEPACGAVFSPFGAIGLSWVQALVAELSLDALLGELKKSTHRTWIDQHKTIKKNGGHWNSNWCKTVSDPGDGGAFLEREWLARKECCVCGES